MQNGKNPQAINTIDRILECAISANWKDFAVASTPTAMRLQYRSGPTHLLKYLKLWLSTSPGHWKLVCEYWMEAGTNHRPGITFTRNYSSPGLSCMLDAILHHQEAFALDPGDRNGLVHVACPDETQLAAARRQLTRLLEHIVSRDRNGQIAAAMRTAADHPDLRYQGPIAHSS